MRITKKFLKNIEEIYKKSGYTLVYDKGRFKGGYCLLEEKKMIVINRYYPLPSQADILIKLLGKLEINKEVLTPKEKEFLIQIKQNETNLFGNGNVAGRSGNHV